MNNAELLKKKGKALELSGVGPAVGWRRAGETLAKLGNSSQLRVGRKVDTQGMKPAGVSRAWGLWLPGYSN